MVTSTAQGIPGGRPINVGLIGSREDVRLRRSMPAGWYPADPPLRCAARIETHREACYSIARTATLPSAHSISTAGARIWRLRESWTDGSADRRQHVRLWMVLESGTDGGPVWLGAASFDGGVTLSRDTGQVTH